MAEPFLEHSGSVIKTSHFLSTSPSLKSQDLANRRGTDS